MYRYLTIVYFFLIAPFYGCEQEVPVPIDEKIFANPSRDLDGKYDIVNLTSEKPVDLDRDGNFSTDILSEANLQNESSKFFIELSTNKLNGSEDLYYQQLYMWVPQTGVFVDNKGTYLYTDYGVSSILGYYRYNSESKTIKLIEKSVNISGVILSTELLKEQQLSVRIKQSYYTTNGWEELTLIGIYKPRD